MNNKIAIYYHAGAYGTFIHWCLNYFSNNTFCDELPFTQLGNSHNFQETNVIMSEKMFNDALFRDDSIIRLHPGTTSKIAIDLLNTPGKANICYKQELELLQTQFKNVIVVYFGLDNILWGANNIIKALIEKNDLHLNYLRENQVSYYEPMFAKNLTDHVLSRLDKRTNDNLKNWNKNSITELSNWELREFLSLYLYEEWTDLYLSLEKLRFEFPNILFLEIGQLRDNFHNTIKNLLTKCNLAMTRDNTTYVYEKWKNLQNFINKDSQIKNIVKSATDGSFLAWDNLSIIDEAEIQRQLRELNWEIKCWNLNTFPKSSVELKMLMHKSQKYNEIT